MPFKETCHVEERVSMFLDYDSGFFSVSEIALRHGISRETFYVWKRRRDTGDARWFDDFSSAPSTVPHATSECQSLTIIETRRRYPHFGPKKIRPGWSIFKRSGHRFA